MAIIVLKLVTFKRIINQYSVSPFHRTTQRLHSMQSLKRNYINTFLTKCKQKASTIATVQYCNRHNIKSEYSETHLCQMVHGCSDPQTQWRPLRCFFTVTRIIDSLSELRKVSVCWRRELEFEFTEEVHQGEFCASRVRVLQHSLENTPFFGIFLDTA